MKYLICIIILFSLSASAVNKVNNTIVVINNTNETIDKINKKKGTI